MTSKVSFTLTSCNRFDLLEKTIKSFLKLNIYPIFEYIISDDSGSTEMYEKIKNLVDNRFKIIHNKTKLGLSKSLDNLFNEVQSDYIFHCEDDWFFDKNPMFISESIEILNENPQIHQVNVRHEYDNPHKSINNLLQTKKGTSYRLMNQHFSSMPNQIWNGYSWNPGLRRKTDYLKMFPNGVSHFGDEYNCCEHSKKFDYVTAILENTSCYHIGYNNRTQNFLP